MSTVLGSVQRTAAAGEHKNVRLNFARLGVSLSLAAVCGDRDREGDATKVGDLGDLGDLADQKLASPMTAYRFFGVMTCVTSRPPAPR